MNPDTRAKVLGSRTLFLTLRDMLARSRSPMPYAAPTLSPAAYYWTRILVNDALAEVAR